MASHTVANTLAADTSSVAFIQLQGAWTAVAATAIFCVLIQTLFAHDVDVGTIWCPLSRCDTLAAPPNSALVIQRRAFAAVCLFLDIFVLLVHWCLPVHPKFVVVRRRRLCIRLHLISGTLQCAAGPAFYALRFGRSPDAARWVCVLTAAVGLCLHLPTALYLLRSAFGAVRLTMPLFLFASSAYGYTLGRLLITGVSGPAAWLEHAFLAYWLCLHVYALNRLCFSLLTRFNLLAHARYDLSVLLGTAAALPAAIGWASLPLALAAVLVFNTAFVCAMDPASQASSDIFSAGGFANRALVKPHLAAPEGLVVAPLSAGSRCAAKSPGCGAVPLVADLSPPHSSCGALWHRLPPDRGAAQPLCVRPWPPPRKDSGPEPYGEVVLPTIQPITSGGVS